MPSSPSPTWSRAKATQPTSPPTCCAWNPDHASATTPQSEHLGAGQRQPHEFWARSRVTRSCPTEGTHTGFGAQGAGVVKKCPKASVDTLQDGGGNQTRAATAKEAQLSQTLGLWWRSSLEKCTSTPAAQRLSKLPEATPLRQARDSDPPAFSQTREGVLTSSTGSRLARTTKNPQPLCLIP